MGCGALRMLRLGILIRDKMVETVIFIQKKNGLFWLQNMVTKPPRQKLKIWFNAEERK
jgi:hypothetical protein